MKKFFNIFAVLLLLVGTMAPSFLYAADTGLNSATTDGTPGDWLND